MSPSRRGRGPDEGEGLFGERNYGATQQPQQQHRPPRRGFLGKWDELKAALSEIPFLSKIFASSDKDGSFHEGGEPPKPNVPRIILRWTGRAIFAVFALAFVFRALFVVYNAPDEWIVIEKKWAIGGPQGIAEKPLERGRYHIVLPVVDTLHYLPAHPIVLDYSADKIRYRTDRVVHFDRAHIQTADAFYTDNDVGIIAKIVDPVKALKGFGPNKGFITNGLQPKSPQALKSSLGLMDTEMYYKWPKLRYALANGSKETFSQLLEYFANEENNLGYKSLRSGVASKDQNLELTAEEKALADAQVKEEARLKAEHEQNLEKEYELIGKAKAICTLGTKQAISTTAILNRELEDRGIEVMSTYVRYFKIADDLQKRIEAKVLQEQMLEQNHSLQLYQKALANLNRIEEEGKQSLTVLGGAGAAYYTEKTGKKEKYQRVKSSDGKTALEKAEAYYSSRERAALEIPGSDMWTAIQTVEALENTGFILTTEKAFQSLLNNWGQKEQK